MAVILVLATFVLFFVVERFINMKASEFEIQTASRAGADEVQSMVAGFEIPENRGIHQVPAGIDRRQVERRGRSTQPAA